jgi:hypothetical protein
MENTTTLDPTPVATPAAVPMVGQQEKITSTSGGRQRVEIITAREVNTTIFTKTWILLASVILMFATCLLIAYLHIYKMFIKFRMPDPFHDSRKHPLNDPHAARG